MGSWRWSFPAGCAVRATRSHSSGSIDSWRPSREPKGARPYIEYHLAQLLDLPTTARRAHVKKMVRLAARHQKRRVKRWTWRAGAGLRIFAPWPGKTMPPAQRAIQISYLKYELSRYDGPVSIYTCQDTIARHAGDQSLGWAKWLTAGFEQVTVPGGHRSVFDSDHIPYLAAAISRSVRRAHDDLPVRYEPIPALVGSVGPARPRDSGPP